MGLSSQLAASSLARPGVCTSSTRPASPYEGQVIYETDTDKTLVWNGSAWVYLSTGTANPVGLELVKTQTIGSAVASVTVSDVFSSTYDNYKIIVSGGSASATVALQLTMGSASTGYYVAAYGYSYAGATQTDTISNGSFWRVGRATSEQIAVTMDIFQPFASDETWFNSNLVGVHTTGNWMGFGGYLANTTSYTAFTLTPASGTLTGGTIRVYGYRNS